jgi:hypothetical protein
MIQTLGNRPILNTWTPIKLRVRNSFEQGLRVSPDSFKLETVIM